MKDSKHPNPSYNTALQAIRNMRSFLLLLVAMSVFVQCGTGSGSDSPAGEDTNVRNLDKENVEGVKIVYVNIDTLLLHYNFAIDINKELIAKEGNVTVAINKSSREIDNVRHKRRNAKTMEEYRQLSISILEKEEEFMKLREELLSEYNREVHARDKELRDSISKYISEYNKVKGYDFILTRFEDNMLYANKALDITLEIAEGLNKRYNQKK